MPRRVYSCKLHRALKTARQAAWDLSKSPWLRKFPGARDAFQEAFQAICIAQALHFKNHKSIMEASEPKE